MAPMATDGQEADRLDGQRHAAGRPLRSAAAALQLFQAAVRPGHESAAGRDSRRDHHLDDHDDRLGGQPARRNARAMPAAAARSADPHERRAGADQGSSNQPGLRSRTLSTSVPARAKEPRACGAGWTSCAREASQAIADGVTILILSDRGVNHEWVPIPALLATSGVHHHLIREETPHPLRPGHRNGRSRAKCIISPCSPATAPARSIRTWPSPRSSRLLADGYICRHVHAREAAEELTSRPAARACSR